MKLNITILASGKRETIKLEGEAHYTVGRSSADIVLEDKRCSRAHCLIFQDAQGVLHLRDLESSNGTRVNGKDVKSSPLKAGDEIEVGGTKLIITAHYTERNDTVAQQKSEGTDPDLITDWANMLRAMPTREIEGFLDYIDKEKIKRSVRLQKLEAKKKARG